MITVAAGFPTTVNPIIQFGAVPIFVDVDLDTHVDANPIEPAITNKTKAMIAHTLGNPFDIGKVRDICDNIIFGCRRTAALGGTYNGQKVGTFGDIATPGFYPAHHITMGEGTNVHK